MTKLLLLTLFFASGCTPAFLEKITTESYDGDETEPFLTERPAYDTASGLLKRVTVNNPTAKRIELEVTCSGTVDETWVSVAPHSARSFFTLTLRRNEHTTTCFLVWP